MEYGSTASDIKCISKTSLRHFMWEAIEAYSMTPLAEIIGGPHAGIKSLSLQMAICPGVGIEPPTLGPHVGINGGV